jgi:hypothetical protein
MATPLVPWGACWVHMGKWVAQEYALRISKTDPVISCGNLETQQQ